MRDSRRPTQFEDREAAGRQLGAALIDRGIEADVVLAIPRGGLPLGRAVADALDVPLDVVVAQKIGAPHNEEFAVGAVAADGSAWLNESIIDSHDVDRDYVERERSAAARAASKKARRYRGDETTPDLAGRRVVIVDDGVATGATARACLEQVQSADPDRVVLAVPVGSPRSIAALEATVADVVCLARPERFRAVGQFYERFDQVSDEEAMAYLDEG